MGRPCDCAQPGTGSHPWPTGRLVRPKQGPALGHPQNHDIGVFNQVPHSTPAQVHTRDAGMCIVHTVHRRTLHASHGTHTHTASGLQPLQLQLPGQVVRSLLRHQADSLDARPDLPHTVCSGACCALCIVHWCTRHTLLATRDTLAEQREAASARALTRALLPTFCCARAAECDSARCALWPCMACNCMKLHCSRNSGRRSAETQARRITLQLKLRSDAWHYRRNSRAPREERRAEAAA